VTEVDQNLPVDATHTTGSNAAGTVIGNDIGKRSEGPIPPQSGSQLLPSDWHDGTMPGTAASLLISHMGYDNSFRSNPLRLTKAIRLSVGVAAACLVNAPALSVPFNPVAASSTATSSVVNQVLNGPSAIFGTLSSNGRVWLVNPAGILVGPSGRVDIAGYVASTPQVINTDFLLARHRLINDGTFKNIVNQSQYMTPVGGSVYLNRNQGTTPTPGSAAVRVSLIDSTAPGVKVDIVVAAGGSNNLGNVTAEAVRSGIASVIVRSIGTVNASNVVTKGGRVFLRVGRE
jgi:filamentous hemagglutinin family protein